MENGRLAQRMWWVVQSPIVVFLIAFGVRLWTASQLLPEKMGPFFYSYNEPVRIAWCLVTGHGYSSPWPNTPLLPTAQQPPGYPFLMAAIFSILGPYTSASLWAAILLNAFFAALTAILILRLGCRDFSNYAGVLAAWVWACWLYEAAVSIRLWENALSALFLTTFLLMLPVIAASNRTIHWFLFGLMAGIAVLTNTSLLALFPFFWIWMWFSCRREKRSCGRQLAFSIAALILVLLPWTIRNDIVFHKLIPVRDNFGLEFWLGNHEGVNTRLDDDFPALNPSAYNRLGELAFMQTKSRLAFTFVREHPMQFLWLSIRRVFIFWTAPKGSLWFVVTLLAWVGLVLRLRQLGFRAVPFLIALAIFPGVYYITHNAPTYRHPIEPLMLLLAAHATGSVAKRDMPLFRNVFSKVGCL